VIRGVVFDIDDTLYLERDYVRSGFAHVAGLVAASDEERREVFDWLWAQFLDGTRRDTFDRLLGDRPGLAGRVTVADIVEAYRRHPPEIALLPGVADVVAALAERGVRLGVLSDGPVESQSAKARALGLDRWFSPVILTAERGPTFHKPADLGFREIATMWDLPPETLAYVADNPRKDFAGANRLGWRTIRLRHREQLRHTLEPATAMDAPNVEIRSLDELLPVLERLR